MANGDQQQTFTDVTPVQQFTDVAPIQQPKPGILDKANEYAGKALSAAGLPTSISNVPDWFRHLTGQAKDSEPFWEPIRRAIKDPTQENLVAAVPFIGQSSVAMSKDVRAGDYGGAAATLAGTVAGPLAAGHVKPGLAAGKAELAEATRTPEGKLTSGTKVASKIIGASAGHALGVPGAGELGGYLLGPQVADAVLPQRPTAPNFYGGAYSPFYGESGAAVPLAKAPTMTGDAAAAYKAGRAGLSPAEAAAARTAKEGTGITLVPEPRGQFSGEVPNYMASVPRGTLEDLALAAKPGAAMQMQQLGTPIIYQPRGTGFSGVKESIPLADLAGTKVTLRPNASGESGASLEAINRAASERAVGAKRVRIDTRSGNEVPLIGADAVDAKPGPYDQIVMRDRNGNETVLDQGVKALPRRPKKP